ncbi:hypothetical protein COCNU_06G009480 [Cocos nucifera]|uniref:Uncharacterized protein n=1 Tax=Cocos nucifera TaxID=13894 RepID=A0A8K0IB64_COCNU|nr:hypothetical protein COCNU_06G009480 [Cocos nucifera]
MAANSILAQDLTACLGRGRGSPSERLVGGRDAFFRRPTLPTRRRRIACYADEYTRKRPSGDDDSTAGIQLYSQIERTWYTC